MNSKEKNNCFSLIFGDVGVIFLSSFYVGYKRSLRIAFAGWVLGLGLWVWRVRSLRFVRSDKVFKGFFVAAWKGLLL